MIAARRRPPMAISLVALTTALVTVLPPAAATAAPTTSSTTTRTASSAAIAGAVVGDRAASGISRAKATKRALQVLKVKKSSEPVRVFALKQIRKPGDRITQAGRSQGKRSVRSSFRAPLVFQLRKRSYVFYADDAPHTLYQHRGRIVIVPVDGSTPTVRRTTFVPLVNGVAPSFLRSQNSYLSHPTVFVRDYSAGTARSENRTPARAVDAAAELAVARTLAEQRTCVVRAATTGFTYGGTGASSSVSGRSVSALGTFYTRLAARAPGLVSVTWSPRKSSASAFINTLIAKRGCRSVLVVAAGGGYVTGAPAVTLGTAVFGGRRATVRAQNLTAVDMSALAARHPGVAISFVLDAPYTGRFSKRLAATANVEALVTPGGTTRPSFSYLPGIRSGGRYVRNPANPRRLQETSNQIVTGLSQFVASPEELRNYQKLRSQGKARSLVSWMLVRSSRLGAVGAIVPKVKGAPTPFVYSPVAVTAPVPRGVPSAEPKTLTVDEDESATVTFAGTDPDGKPLTFEVVDAPAHGVLAPVAGGVRYTPAANFHGSDSFTYRAIADDGVKSAPATVSVTVAPVNDGPTGGAFDTSVDEDSASTTVAAPGLLAGANDIDGDQLAVTPATGAGTGGGDFDVRADGSFDYDPNGAFEDLAAGVQRVDTFAVTVEDPSGLSATVTIRVRVVGENDAPTLGGGTGSASFTEGDATGVIVHSDVTVADVDNADLTGATVSIGAGFDATEDRLIFTDTSDITGSYNAATGVFTLAGSASKAAYQTALRSVRYKNTDTDDPSSATRVISLQVNDGSSANATSNTVRSDVTVNAVNDQPTITAGSSAASFTEGGAPVKVDETVTVTDVDNANLAGATVQITGNHVSNEDILAFVDTADITGSYNTGTGTLTLTGSDTKADYRAALRSVTYENTDTDTPSTATRTVTFKVTDGALISSAATSTVAVVAVNSAPRLSQSSGTAAYTEDGSPAAVAANLVAVDPDSANLSGAVVTLTTNRESPDRLGYTAVSGITGTYDNTTGILALEGEATVAQYQAALRSITFRTVSDTPSTATRTLTVAATDTDGADSNTLTRTITVAAANDAPVLVAGTQPDVTFTEGDSSPVRIDAGITVSDPDSADLRRATVKLTTHFSSAEDVLMFPTSMHGVNGAYNPGAGTLTFTGTASKADYQDILRNVKYRNTSSTPDVSNRTVEFQVSDADDASNVSSKDIAIVSLNDAPVLGGGGNTLAYTEDDAATVVNNGVTVTDGDDTNIESAKIAIEGGFDNTEDTLTFADTGSITGSYNATTGVLTLTGTATKASYQAALRTVKYVNNNHAAPSSASRTISFTANDGEADSDPITTTVTITQKADAPTLTAGTANTNTFTEGGSAVVVDDAIAVADVDSTNLVGAVVVISAGSVTGDLLDLVDQNGISGSWNAATKTLSLTGTTSVANYQAALRSITFSSTSDAPGTSRTISFVVSDSAGPSDAVTHGVTVTPVNDSPVLGGGGTLAYTENDAATAVSPALTLTDPDGPSITGATVSITGNLSAGQDRLSFTDAAPISGSYNATTGVLTLTGTGTVAQYQAALREVKYDNTSDNPSTAARTLTYSATDGTLSGTETATVSVTAVNDAPVADDESFSGADAAIGNTVLVGDDATDGAPNPAGPQKTISANILGGDTDAEGDSLSVVPGAFSSNDGGSVTVQADGDFTFTPAADISCSDHSDFFDYTVTDGAAPTPGTDTGRVTIAITDCVWYVDNTASVSGNGTSGAPFDTLVEADTAASTTGAYVYVYQGDGTTAGLTGGVSLLANQRLVGAAEDLTVAGTTLENGSDANRPAISGSVTLAAGNTVEGLAITGSGVNTINGGAGDASGTLDDLVLTPSGAAGAGISLNGTSGTWNISDTTITATSGAQGFFASSAGTVNFTSAGTISVTAAGPAFSALSTAVSGVIDTTTSTGGSYGWALNAVTGSIDLGTGTVSGHTSTELSVTAGTGDVTYAGTIGNGSGTSAVVQNRTTGAITLSGDITDSNDAGGGITMSGNSGGSTTFSGATKTLNTGSSTAVSLAFTGGHTVSFTGGGLDIDTTSGSGITSASANGFVAVTGTGNTIDVSSGTSGTKGLNLNGPDIPASGLTFQRISTTASDNGIVLANTGSAGGLTVTGTGTSGSGGVITTSTGAGVSLTSTRDIALSGVNVTNGGDDGIRASSVTNLAIAGDSGTGLASAITGNGNAGGENGFDLTELAGVVTISNATVTGNYDNNVALTNDAATLTNLTIDGGSYGTTNSTGGNDSIQIVNTGTGNLTGTIKNANFMNSRGDHIQLVTDNDPTTTSTQKLTIQNNTLNSTALSSTVLGGGIALGVGGGATQTVVVDDNDIDHAHGAPMSFNTSTGTSPNANWTVNNNRIGNTGEVKSGSVANSGFYVNVNGNGNAKFNLTNNTIMQTDFTAVDAVQNDGNAAMNITMKGNVITEPGTTIDYAYGLRFVIGSDDGDAGTSCLDLGHPSTTALKNRFFGSGNSGQGYQDVRLRMAGDATVNLAGFTGGPHDNAAVNSWMQTRNNIGGTPTTSSSQFDADSFYGQATSCPLPSVP